MNDLPGELTGNGPQVSWLNKLRKAVMRRTPLQSASNDLVQSDNGFTYSGRVRSPGSSAQTLGGRFLGPGWGGDEATWPDFGIINPYDFVYYFSDPDSEAGRRAFWFFAWSGPASNVAPEISPIARLRAGFLYLLPTNFNWFLMNYVPIDEDSQQIPNTTAQTELLDFYSNQ